MASKVVEVKLTEVEAVKERIANLTAYAALMVPVVEAARAWYANGVDPEQRYTQALWEAVEAYEQVVERWTGVA